MENKINPRMEEMVKPEMISQITLTVIFFLLITN